ncbi:hypothetical protein NE237_029468 [Protea cynaroides]|uniref:Zinc finger PHD-type domain-containing protein n=1 Tax=Protea cynaroides TaxID=273540 RepID=A0A9Q0JUV0_9MAGN|nr:hypothetical protein NE237_029468 [Protea cynaroides]
MNSTKRGRITLFPKRYILTNETPIQVTEGAEICRDNDEIQPLKRLKNGNIDCDILHNMSLDNKVLLNSNPVVSQWNNFDNADHDNNEMSVSHLNGSKEDFVNEIEDRNEGHAEGGTSSDKDVYCGRTLYFNLNDAMLIAAAKHRFLNSQSIHHHDSWVTSDQKAERICCKCTKDGQMLICSVRCCRLVVRESCLGSPASDDKGNFQCPFCSYERAITVYHDAKKKAALARRCLVTFASLGNSYQQKFKPRSTSQGPQSRTTNVDLPDKSHDNGEQKEMIANQLMQVVEHQKEAEDTGSLRYVSCTEAKTYIGLERNDISLIGEHLKPDNEQQSKGVGEDQLPTEPLNACFNDDLPLGGEETFAITKAPSVSPTVERGNANITAQPERIVGGGEEKKKQAQMLQKQAVNPLPEPSSQPTVTAAQSTVTAKETSKYKNDNENVSSDGFRRLLQPTTTARSFPVLSSRRRKVTWTDEEDRMLLV